jgi:hypothetical protein
MRARGPTDRFPVTSCVTSFRTQPRLKPDGSTASAKVRSRPAVRTRPISLPLAGRRPRHRGAHGPRTNDSGKPRRPGPMRNHPFGRTRMRQRPPPGGRRARHRQSAPIRGSTSAIVATSTRVGTTREKRKPCALRLAYGHDRRQGEWGRSFIRSWCGAPPILRSREYGDVLAVLVGVGMILHPRPTNRTGSFETVSVGRYRGSHRPMTYERA